MARDITCSRAAMMHTQRRPSRSRHLSDGSYMAQAAAQLGLDTYALIGMSFGGRMALWQVLQSPQQVDLLVLIAPTPPLQKQFYTVNPVANLLGTATFFNRT